MTGELKSEEWKGYVYAIVGTIAFSSLYVFSKAGLNQVELAQFGLYYFGMGFLLNLVFILLSGKRQQIARISKKVWLLLVFIGILDVITNITFFMAIQVIPDPSVTSFLGNLFPVFLSIMGITFLKERFSRIEALGAMIALAGAFAISYSGEMSWSKFFIPGTGLVVINTLFAATVSMIIKKNTQKASPEVFNLNSNGWIFIFFLLYFLNSGQSGMIPAPAFLNIALGAFFGSFIGLLSFYYSYRYMAASRSSIIQSLKGIFVLIIAYFYFGNFPLPIQLAGGAITIAGVIMMTLAKGGIFRANKE
ncbi:MAG TPA: DMT family transporter [Prolixibacteraceae bacterium]|nr:DMT family transporter [Prolixibacteraceae bacterium]